LCFFGTFYSFSFSPDFWHFSQICGILLQFPAKSGIMKGSAPGTDASPAEDDTKNWGAGCRFPG